MNARTTGRSRSTILVIVGAVALAGTLAAGAALAARGNGETTPTTPSNPPIATAKPSTNPTPRPSTAPTAPPTSPEPSEDPGTDAMPIRVDLDVIGGDAVYVDVVDSSGHVVGATAGPRAESVSVEYGTLLVENVDADTLRLTWSDYPIDNALALYIDETADGHRFLMIQPEPQIETDAMAFDRVLFLDFDEPTDAGEVEAFLQGGLDTPGDDAA